MTYPLQASSPDPLNVSLWRRLAHAEWPTVFLLLGCVLLWSLALMLPAGWGPVSFSLLVVALTLHSSLTHEILHGHPLGAPWAGTALGLIQPGLFVPYLRFKALHLAHHQDARLKVLGLRCCWRPS